MNPDEALPIQIKADRDGFLLAPDPAAPISAIIEHIEKRLGESHDFFHGSKMALDLRERPFRADEILALRQTLEEKANVKLAEVRVGENRSFIFEWVSQQLGVDLKEAKEALATVPKPRPVIVRTTCRSGARVESPAECVILGDVNPGAEVLADGDIVIFGSLRGMAHAGASGDRSAKIWALSIEPNQIRIADLVAVPPRGSKPVPKRFEIAEIREERIQVITI
jgi:septum site-determining protein MinC